MAGSAVKNIWTNIQIDSSNIMAAAGVLAILLIMVMPIPATAMDILLAFNMSISLLILLLSLYIIKPLDFPIFPSLLLLTTLFRLSLNIATTRLILIHGHEGIDAAGRIIMGFGQFAVGGNFVVGAIVFSILVIINFVVITKGAGRIAEVAARFTLDAMPGKQMAIDADLNAGLIDEKEARARRKDIAKEAEFYGAMDGASKFVRGEAIAGLIIMAINIIGGFVIGVIQQGLPIAAAARSYTLLTIGDGLVSQIPALIISTAAGILVSRAASDAGIGREFIRQFAAQPEALAITSAMIFFFGMIPGLPAIPFSALSIGLGTLSFLAYKEKHRLRAVSEAKEAPAAKAPKAPEPGSLEEIERLLSIDVLALEMGYGLIPLVDEEQGGDLLERIKSIRRQFAQEMGVIVPPLHVRDNLQLKPSEYSILIKGVEAARGELMMGHLLAMNPGDVKKEIKGIPTTEPAFGLPALWIPESERDEAQIAGYTVVDLSAVVATHIAEVIRQNADELLGRQEVQRLLDTLAKTYPKAVEEATNACPLGVVQKVLQSLVKEKVPIRDLLTIVEALADYGPFTKDPEVLAEYVRQRLGKVIIKPFLKANGTLPVITMDFSIEEQIKKGIQQTEHGSFLALDAASVQHLAQAIKKGVEDATAKGYQAVILTSPNIRRHLKKLIDRFAPNVSVLSHTEIQGNVKLESIAAIR
ncbi:MAG: flagellar biosynthesis protein FlhA [Dissulfurimicrobium hydrothermale]|uniref:flagellar biosynthesis protein FlhA n=3 Tax=Dissulfurimicrobium TaxID=1769732 RepID=UPI003C74AB41